MGPLGHVMTVPRPVRRCHERKQHERNEQGLSDYSAAWRKGAAPTPSAFSVDWW